MSARPDSTSRQQKTHGSLWIRLTSVGMLIVVIAVAAILLASSATAGTTSTAATNYSYDRTAPYAQSASATAPHLVLGMDVGTPANPARQSRDARPSDFLAAEEEADAAGIVYGRTDLNGAKPYVGQAKSADRFVARQAEHARANPDADFEFEILGRAEPGTELDRLEEYWIRERGGPTNKGNPGGLLGNARHQMSDPRYQAAGGSPFP